MKKLLTIATAAALTLAAAGQASAAALETKGEYRGRYWYLSNYNGFKGAAATAAADDSMDMWDQRFRLNMAWQVSEGVKVGARADILENTWDFTTGTNDKSEIDFDHTYIDVALAGATKMQLGKMDVSWGPGMYAKADNRYRARLASKFGGVSAAFAYDMVTENADDKAKGDNYALTLGAAFPIGANTLGILGIYGDNKATAGVDTTITAIDAFFTGAIGSAKINAELAYAMGKNDRKSEADNDREGLMGYLGCSLPLGPVGLGLEVGYAQGNDPNTADDEGVLFHDYNGPFNSFILFNNFDLDGWNSVYSGGVDKGLNNALAGKLSATMSASKELSFMGALVYAVADQTKAAQKDDMGVEVDLLAKYAVNENLTLQAGFGYLSAGEYYGKDVDDPWVATAHAIVTF